MASQPADPVASVSAPIRGAVEAILVRAAASYAVVVLTVLWAHPPIANAGARVLAHYLLPALLALYVAAHSLGGLRRRNVPEVDAWSRAHELVPRAARVAKLAAVLTPLGVAIAGASLLEPHLVDAADRAWALGIATPAFAFLWVLATLAWSDDCHDRLARAAVESDGRFRAYWSDVVRR